jgi:hypothetical protein
MADAANVLSVDALKDFRASWVSFAEDARNALMDVDFDLRRTVDWLTHDQRLYWQAEIKRRNQELSQARTELHRKKLSAMQGSHPDTVAEEKALRLAKTRLEEAEDKLEAVRAWIPELQHAAQEYRSHSQPLGDMLEGEVKNALALLDRMIDALESYLSLHAPSTTPLDGGQGFAQPAAAPGTPASVGTAPAEAASKEKEDGPPMAKSEPVTAASESTAEQPSAERENDRE